MFGRKFISTTALVFGLTLALTSCGDSSGSGEADSGEAVSGKLTPLKVVASVPGTPYAPYLIALERGLFAKQGVKVEEVKVEGSAIGTALASNSIDVAVQDGPSAANAIGRGAEMKIIGAYNLGLTATLVVSNEFTLPPASSDWEAIAKALEGKKIGITSPGAGTDAASRYLLSEAGLKPGDDAEVVAVGSASYLPALQQGKVDAVMSFPPMTYTLLQKKVGKIGIDFMAGEGPPLAQRVCNVCVVAAAGALADDTKRDALKGFMTAIQEAQEYIKSDVPRAAQEVVNIMNARGIATTLDAVEPDIEKISERYAAHLTEEDLGNINAYRAKLNSLVGQPTDPIPSDKLYQDWRDL